MKLSPAMERALSKLTDEWQTPREIGERGLILNTLARYGLVEDKSQYSGIVLMGCWYRKKP